MVLSCEGSHIINNNDAAAVLVESHEVVTADLGGIDATKGNIFAALLAGGAKGFNKRECTPGGEVVLVLD